MKKLLRMLAIIASVIALNAVPSLAQACTPSTQPVTGPATISFDPNVANGTILWTGNLNVAASSSDCIGGTASITYTGIGPQEMTYHTYGTGIAGVGVRLKFITQSCNNGAWFPIVCTGNWTPVTIVAHSITVEFVKIGTVTAGGTVSGIFSTWSTNIAASPVWAYYTWASPIHIAPAVPTCTVTTPTIAVTMGSVPLTSFTGVGSTSASQPFNISLTCSGGAGAAYTNVYTTLTDATNPSNVSNTLFLTASSTAQGVGIQVLNNGTPVNFGPDSSSIGNVNQWFAGAAQNGVFNIPLTARYVQTGSTVSPGSANARATFTMSYQ